MRPARLERATSWFVARRSIQLSYGRGRVRIVCPICSGRRTSNKHQLYHPTLKKSPIKAATCLYRCHRTRDHPLSALSLHLSPPVAAVTTVRAVAARDRIRLIGRPDPSRPAITAKFAKYAKLAKINDSQAPSRSSRPSRLIRRRDGSVVKTRDTRGSRDRGTATARYR